MVALSSLSVAAADSTAAGGRLTARPYITTCTNSPREREREEGGGGGVRRLRERETEGERSKGPLGKERETENGKERV